MPTQNMGEGVSGGNKAAKGLEDTTKAAQGLHSALKDIEKTVSKLLADFGKLSSSMGGSKSGGVSLPAGMGDTQSSGIMGQDLQQQIDSVYNTLQKKFTPPPSIGERIGTGLGYATKAAFGAMAVMPNTDDAVTQRITAQSVASMSGMSALNLISTSNALLQGGMTGPYSAQTSAAALASSGILPTMGSYQNIMSQVGGFSILTGMTNEQTAAGFAGINGMNYLRLGIRARNPDGSIKDPNEIANLLYKRMYGGRQVTAEQAAQVYNPHSRAYQDVMAAAGGDPALFQSLAAATVYQARNGGKKLDMSSQNVKDNILKLPKDDPMRALYNYQGSEANKLGATGENLVKGYSDALNLTSSANNLFASIARYAGPIADGLARLAGILTTLPQAGNMGAGLTGGFMGLGGKLMDGIMGKLEDKGIKSVADFLGLGGSSQEELLQQLLTGEGGGGEGGGPTYFGGPGGRGGEGGRRGFRGGRGALAAEGEALTLGRAVKNTGGVRSLFARGGLKALAKEAGGKRGLLKLAGKGAGRVLGGVFKGLMLADLAREFVLDPAIDFAKHFGESHHLSSGTQKGGTILARTGEYAAMGAIAGSFVPGLGTAIGAGIGAVIGTGIGLYQGMREANTGGDGGQDYQTGGDVGQDYQTGGDGGTGKSVKDTNPHSKPKLHRPTGGKITAWYHQEPKDNTYWQWKGYHTGTDFGVPSGTKVVALTDGKVKAIGSGGAWGNNILIGHDGYDSFYAHLSKVDVKKGDKVTGGQQIGLSGQTGSGAKRGPHLHFEIRQGIDNPVNPAKWLKGLIPESPIVPGLKEKSGVGKAVDVVTHAVSGIGHGIGSVIKNAISDVTGTIQRFYDSITGNDGGSSTTSGSSGGFAAVNGKILSADATGMHSSETSGVSGLSVQIPVPSTDGFGGDSSGMGLANLGTAINSTSLGNASSNVTINMNVTVTHGNTQDAVRLARDVKNILERELRVNKLSEF